MLDSYASIGHRFRGETMARTVSNQIRAAIKASGMTRYRISLATGIDQAVLSRFMAGKTGLSMKSLDKLGRLLDLQVRLGRPAKRKGR